MHVPTNQHDLYFRRLGICKEVLLELVRLGLAMVFFLQLDTKFGLKVLNPQILGLGEADLVVLARLDDGRYLLIVWEHKSFYAKYAKLQLARYVCCKAYELVQDGQLTEGKMPIMYGVVARHREASKYPPEDLDDLAGLTEEERKVAMNTFSIADLDFGKIGLDDLCDDPKAGGPILPLTVGWDGRALDDRGLAYVGRSAGLHSEEMRGYIVERVTEELGVPVERWLAVLAREENQEEAKVSMDAIKEQLRGEGRVEGRVEGLAKGRVEGLAKGRVEGLADGFLRAAARRFQSVPEHLAAQARGASPDQIDAWFDRLYDASDLESVFSGSGNGDASE